MRKTLLSAMLISACAAMAIEQPQTGFYLAGINEITEKSDNNTLTYQPGDEDDLEEGIFRYVNEAVEITEGNGTFMVIGDEGMELGYDDNNFMGALNVINDIQNMLYLKEDGYAINYKLTPGTYKVILASMMMEEDEPLTWMIQFVNQTTDETVSYYLYGFNGLTEPTHANMLVEQVIEGEDEDGDMIMYTYPKFYIEDCENGFYVGTSDFSVIYGSDSAEISDELPFAMLSQDGEPVKANLKPGYYTVNFTNAGMFSMISFLLCEDQTPADEATYYLLGFEGVSEPSDDVKFSREIAEYEDEETGEVTESVIYIIEKIHLTSCPDGFTVATESGDFTFGINTDYSAVFGTSVTDTMPFGFLGNNGEPYGWDMEENDYTVTFICNDPTGAMASIAFAIYEDSGVETVSRDENENAEPVYYNLQGQCVNNPDKGLFIKVQGNKAIKILK